MPYATLQHAPSPYRLTYQQVRRAPYPAADPPAETAPVITERVVRSTTDYLLGARPSYYSLRTGRACCCDFEI